LTFSPNPWIPSRGSQTSWLIYSPTQEQKLYDIGESITQFAPTLLTKRPNKTLSTSETKDLLKSILDVLSRTRGSQSYLFSTLLQKSQDILQANHLPPSAPAPPSSAAQLFTSSKKMQAQSQPQPQSQRQSRPHSQPQLDVGFLSIEMVAEAPEDTTAAGGITSPDALGEETRGEAVNASHGFKQLASEGHGSSSDLYLPY
jgi:hypothetical protein